MKRIAYIDFIKVFAMFIVTIGHCAQALSCQTFPEKIIPNDFFVSIHMPLFMIASGYVLNFDKIREKPFKEYINGKFSRLIIPMLMYILIYCIVTFQIPKMDYVFNTYWYLSALFISLLVIRVFASIIKNNTTLIVLTLIVVLLIPFSKTSHVNFMFPFLIYGYFLKRYIDKLNCTYLILFAVLFLILYVFCWEIEYTIYLTPFYILSLDKKTIYSFSLRFIIGICGSTFIFIIIRKFDTASFVQKISYYGKYTLVFYTMTTIINGFTRRTFSFFNIALSNPYIIDFAAIIFSLIQMYIIYLYAKRIKKYKIASKLLLGC